MRDPALRIAALGVVLVPFTAPTTIVVSEPPRPLQSARADTNAMLVATLANGEIQAHWRPEKICERIVSEVHAGIKIFAISSDGTVLKIDRANCRAANS
jgi:hypothetical protein